MHDVSAHLLTVFFGFFAIMNPIANTAAFTALAGHKSKAEQINIAARALTITFIIIVLFTLLGNTIFHLFGISLSSLRIAGGIIVFIVGYHMLSGSGSSMHAVNLPDKAESDIAISPLAMPLLAGPGTIASAMNYASSGSLLEISITIAMFGLLCGITYLCFIFSSTILKTIGENGLSIVTRLMGLILAVMGTQMVIEGIQTVNKTL
jgi:multiple antibiotic resistance protein